MKPKRLVTRFVVILSLAFLPVTAGACGFFLTHGPPEGYEQMSYFTCTEEDIGPILDFAWAGLNVAGAIICAAQGDDYYNESGIDSGTCTAVGLTWGVVSTSAGIVGVNKTKKCRDAHRQLSERQAQGRAGELVQPADLIVQTVVLTPALDTLTVGQQVQLVASAYNSRGVIIANRMFSWSSSNDAICSVNNSGIIMAHAIGSVVIAARTDNVVGTSHIVVVSPAEGSAWPFDE